MRGSRYLACVVVGELDFVSLTTKTGVVIRVLAPPGRAHDGWSAAATQLRFAGRVNSNSNLEF